MVEALCIGHACYDLSFFLDGFLAENSKSETSLMLEAGGGPAANAAYLLSVWGCRCAFAWLVGDDEYGKRVRAEFQAAGTDTSLLELRPGHCTPVSTILVNRLNGSRTIVNRKATATPLNLSPEALRPFSPGVLVLDGHELSASLAALEAFPRAISILDAGSWREGTAALAGRVTYLAASERFARQACATEPGAADALPETWLGLLRGRYGNAVVITLGERGLVADDGSGPQVVRAQHVRAVDTTGAGDIFHGAFAYGILRGRTFAQALDLATATATLSVQRPGGRQSVPSIRELE